MYHYWTACNRNPRDVSLKYRSNRRKIKTHLHFGKRKYACLSLFPPVWTDPLEEHSMDSVSSGLSHYGEAWKSSWGGRECNWEWKRVWVSDLFCFMMCPCRPKRFQVLKSSAHPTQSTTQMLRCTWRPCKRRCVLYFESMNQDVCLITISNSFAPTFTAALIE